VKRTSFLVPGVVIASMLLAACGDQGGQGQPQMPPPEVTTVTLVPERVTLTRELPGRTNAFLVAEVRPQVNGIIEKRLFTEGGMVEAGQPLYQLEDATYRADYNSAKASLQRAEAALQIAKLNAERSSELVDTGAVSRQQHDQAMSTLAQAEAEVAVARAAVERARVMLGYAKITSPISGRIGRSTVTPGALVTANQPQALATVQQLDPIYVDLTQSASELLELRRAVQAGTVEEAELPVTIILEGGARFPHEGKLAFSEVSVDPSTGSYLLRVVVPNPDHILMPGMYVRAVVGRGVRENAILAPQQAILRDAKGNTSALVVNGDNVVEARQVRVSRAIGNRWLVEEGLNAGERVIVAGVQKVQPGMPVNPVDAAAAGKEQQQPANTQQQAGE